ncbi:hypothetical protein ACN429_23270 [Pseudomonas oryzihabitans]|uniref:hypothetical protein n=1 Tax=Pseudomonas oryzihabitans TaxID=47885 RepID=UPI0036388309
MKVKREALRHEYFYAEAKTAGCVVDNAPVRRLGVFILLAVFDIGRIWVTVADADKAFVLDCFRCGLFLICQNAFIRNYQGAFVALINHLVISWLLEQ